MPVPEVQPALRGEVVTAQDDALAVARFLRPRKNPARPGSEYARQEDEIDRNWIWNNIAAAEAVLVERGLGEQYGAELVAELKLCGHVDLDAARIRTAPLDVCLRAMAAVVRKQQEAKR